MEVDTEAAPPAAGGNPVVDAIFKDLKRTKKSVAIVEFLASQAGNDLTVDQIVAGADLDKIQVSSWLAATMKSVPGLTKVSRGVYKFVPA